MRNFITILASLLTSFTFSYWKFKGPLITDICHPNGYNTNETITHAYNHPFLYDKHTNYFLTIGEFNPARSYFKTIQGWQLYENIKDEQFEFLKGNFDCQTLFLNRKYQYFSTQSYVNKIREGTPYIGKAMLPKQNKYFLKEDIISLFNHMNRRIPWNCFFDLQPLFPIQINLNIENTHYIEFSKQIKKHPKIYFINNINGVLLTNGEKTIDFQEALLEYYGGQRTLDQFVKNLESFHENITNHTNPLFTTKQKADKLFSPLTKLSLATPKEMKLLQNSKIIAVWDFIADTSEPLKQYTILGLAKDNQTKKKFHWITKIPDDLSVLFSLGSPIK